MIVKLLASSLWGFVCTMNYNFPLRSVQNHSNMYFIGVVMCILTIMGFILNSVSMTPFFAALMAWSSSTLTSLVIVVICSSWLGLVRSCEFVELFERLDDPQPFLQKHAPSTVARRLGSCSRWCTDTVGCLFFTWSFGLCAQVGSSGSENVTTTVYIVNRNTTVPGKQFWLTYWLLGDLNAIRKI